MYLWFIQRKTFSSPRTRFIWHSQTILLAPYLWHLDLLPASAGASLTWTLRRQTLLAWAPWPAGFIGQCAKLCPRHWMYSSELNRPRFCLARSLAFWPADRPGNLPVSRASLLPSFLTSGLFRSWRCPLSQVSSSLGRSQCLVLRVSEYSCFPTLKESIFAAAHLGALSPSSVDSLGQSPLCAFTSISLWSYSYPFLLPHSPETAFTSIPLHAGFFSLSTETVPSVTIPIDTGRRPMCWPWCPPWNAQALASLTTLLGLFPLGGHFLLGFSMHLSSCNYPLCIRILPTSVPFPSFSGGYSFSSFWWHLCCGGGQVYTLTPAVF